MTLRDIAKRLRADPEEFEHDRLRKRFEHLDVAPLSGLVCRQRACVGGEVKRIQVAPRSGVPSLEVVLTDGTGDAIAIFTGRRSIPGIEHGRALTIEGVAREERGRRIMLNPAYVLLAH